MKKYILFFLLGAGVSLSVKAESEPVTGVEVDAARQAQEVVSADTVRDAQTQDIAGAEAEGKKDILSDKSIPTIESIPTEASVKSVSGAEAADGVKVAEQAEKTAGQDEVKALVETRNKTEESAEKTEIAKAEEISKVSEATEVPEAAKAIETVSETAADVSSGEDSAPYITPVSSMEEVRSMGNPNAPLKMYVFSSLTCPHCSDFYKEIMPFVEKEFVRTGDIFLTYVDLPYDRRSLAGAMIAHCVPTENYFDFLGLLYEKQREWAFLPNAQEVVTNYALAAGLTRQEVRECLKNQKVLRKLMVTRDEMTKKYKIRSTPTVVLEKGDETKMVLGADKTKLLKKIKSMMKD